MGVRRRLLEIAQKYGPPTLLTLVVATADNAVLVNAMRYMNQHHISPARVVGGGIAIGTIIDVLRTLAIAEHHERRMNRMRHNDDSKDARAGRR